MLQCNHWEWSRGILICLNPYVSQLKTKSYVIAKINDLSDHGLQMPCEEIAFSARLKIHSHSQIFVSHIVPNFHISLIYVFMGCP